MNLTDSSAAFERQAVQLGLHEECLAELKAAGVNTLGRLAFACGQPGAAAAEAAIRQLLTDSAPTRVMSVGDVAIMRRLVFEAQTSVIAQSRALADPTADPTQNKIPACRTKRQVVCVDTRRAA